MSQLNDRSVIVTGGATLIGAAVAEAFVEAGAAVTVIDIDAEAGAALADRLGAKAQFIAA
ncbi:SDR family NAD(P)-dependent oxidoreductase, partial [Amphritea sp.]|uniref:SDR family NAD(P)-dependent oxidoreductase n=1 Tax=Amphritea sp. TaxID=1872502 RepID=UPI003562832D